MTATPLVGSTFFGIDISQLGEQLSSMRRRVSKRVLVLEFGTDLLHLAEACLTQQGVQLNHISSVALPPEALDRGVPAEPAKMASLIQQICTEKKIPAHRVAVVLPPEVAFQRLVDLPGELTTEEAREYVLDPAKGVQLPFPLAQTDFDLVPMSTPSMLVTTAIFSRRLRSEQPLLRTGPRQQGETRPPVDAQLRRRPTHGLRAHVLRLRME